MASTDTNRITLIVAVVAGLMAMGMAFVYLRSVSGASAELPKAEPTTKVVVAATKLGANHVLDPDNDLKVEPMPSKFTKNNVKASEIDAVRGRRITRPIPQGHPLLHSDLVAIADLELSPGMVAMSLDVDRAGGLVGILVPGDRVDVVVSHPKPAEKPNRSAMPTNFDPNNTGALVGAVMDSVMSQVGGQSPEWESKIVLSNVTVLAVGTRLNLSRQQMLLSEDRGLRGGGTTVTLQLSRENAIKLIGARGGGSNLITLLLLPKEGVDTSLGGGSLQ